MSLRSAIRVGRLQIVNSIADINFAGIRVWMTDIENTIAHRKVGELDEATQAVFRRAYSQGVRVIALLTNKKLKELEGSGDFSKMVKQLEDIGLVVFMQQPLGWYKWPRKPWRAYFRRARHRAEHFAGHLPPEHILMSGDKLRFDVLRPIRMGWNVALVNPLGSDGRGDKFALIRPIERFTLFCNRLKRADLAGSLSNQEV